MKQLLFALGALWLINCTTTQRFTSMNILPVSPVLSIGSEKYDIIGNVQGTGKGLTYEIAKDAAVGAAVLSNKDADAIILPRFETTYRSFTFPLLNYFFPPEYTVICRARGIKLKQ